MNAVKKKTVEFLDRLADEIMTSSVISIAEDASVREAMAMLIDRRISGAPVVNHAGRPVGVISQSDILIHDRNAVSWARRVPEYFSNSDLTVALGESVRGFEVEAVDRTTVRDVMTPIVFSASPNSSIRNVIQEMLRICVHRMFVTDDDGVLVGVVSMSDIVRHLLD